MYVILNANNQNSIFEVHMFSESFFKIGEWINDNRAWIFDGIGVLIISGIVTFLWHIFRKKEKNISGKNVTIIEQGSTVTIDQREGVPFQDYREIIEESTKKEATIRKLEENNQTLRQTLSQVEEDLKESIERNRSHKEDKEILKKFLNEKNYQKVDELLLKRIIDSKDNLEDAYYEYGLLKVFLLDFKKGIEYLKKAEALNPTKFEFLNSLGLAYQAVGEHSEAIKYFQKVDKSSLTIEDNIAYLVNSAISLYFNGNRDLALENLNTAENVSKQLTGNADVLAALLGNLGFIHLQEGDSKKALDYLLKARKLIAEKSPPFHILYAPILNNIGSIYFNKGDYVEAFSVFKKAVSIDRSMYGKVHPNIYLRYRNIGMCLIMLKKYKIGRKFLDYAFNGYISIFGEKNADLSELYSNYASLEEILNNPSQAEEYYKKALENDQKIFGKESFRAGIRWEHYGAFLAKQREYKSAIECYEEALNIYMKTPGVDVILKNSTCLNISGFYLILGDSLNSRKYMNLAVKILTEPEDPAVRNQNFQRVFSSFFR